MELTQREQFDFNNFCEKPVFVTDPADKDYPWHGGKWGNESWFVCANLNDNGHKIGFLAHALILSMPGKGDMLSIKISISDQTTGWYKAYESVYPAQAAEISQTELLIKTKEFLMKGDLDEVIVQANMPDSKIDVVLKRTHSIFHLGGGQKFDFLGVEQYDFAIPAMETSGEVQIEGISYRVSGPTWIDRQWGGLPNYYAKGDSAETRMKWLWMNLQLDNGVNISCGIILLIGPNIISQYAGIQLPDGSTATGRISKLDMYDYWTSEESGNSYPTRYYMEIPCIDTKLEIQANPIAQEIVAQLKESTKYEGAADIKGTCMGKPVTGVNYIELVGYWK
ncbi:lipocalin family protein [Parasporobacterium paucivorans]|uniref:Hydroxyneurosporene synthase (CrtC) n=1 Tax=Parasporobacterium paucivorans DSM 15970 TaxID=1122934 RepID=A0A1M6KTX7_9FIRM|nr:lipocalin family protein [Parasporobacterium paucivorans]SHJ62417.1 Hydroxyneurosporene synthase (CrtC) [Parasporobacterium paucivorans DSM 15970]